MDKEWTPASRIFIALIFQRTIDVSHTNKDIPNVSVLLIRQDVNDSNLLFWQSSTSQNLRKQTICVYINSKYHRKGFSLSLFLLRRFRKLLLGLSLSGTRISDLYSCDASIYSACYLCPDKYKSINGRKVVKKNDLSWQCYRMYIFLIHLNSHRFNYRASLYKIFQIYKFNIISLKIATAAIVLHIAKRRKHEQNIANLFLFFQL